tara:strand:- start:129 stop:335 length:207 start_codon:yes stop_codon:yes gene_type:complete
VVDLEAEVEKLLVVVLELPVKVLVVQVEQEIIMVEAVQAVLVLPEVLAQEIMVVMVVTVLHHQLMVHP